MEKIYKSVLLLVHSLTRLAGVCYKYSQGSKEEKEETAEKLTQIVDNCEKKFLKVKEEIVKMVFEEEVEKEDEISAIKTESGFLIKE